MSPLLEAALRYAREGWRVMPLHYPDDSGTCDCVKGSDCTTPAKHPRIRDWPTKATTDEDTIRRWWGMWPDSNVGVATGGGVLVLDIDPRHGGDKVLERLEAKHGKLPDTERVATGGGGLHYVFKAPEGTRSRDLEAGVELKAAGRLVVVPPSLHASGREYAPLGGIRVDAPAWLLNGAARRKGPAQPVGDTIPHGTQHTTLVSLAGSMRNRGMGETEIAAALIETNRSRCERPGTDDEIRKIAADVCRLYEPGESRNGSKPPGDADAFFAVGANGRTAFVPSRLGEHLRAEAPVATGGEELHVYRGGAYRPGGDAHLRRRISELLGEKWRRPHADETVAFLRDSSPRLLECPPLDRVNCANGVLDLATGTLEPHDPRFLTPVQIAAAFDPDATCPAIDAFIGQVLDSEVQRIFYELAGYLIAPDNRLQTAIMFLGGGANGKSTALGVQEALLGSPNVAAVPLHKLDEDRFATADLYGKLANIFADLDARALRSSSMFKAITGGDAVQAERKFRPAFTFRPYARLLFSANEPPPTPDSSEAFFRRWLIMPFDRSFAAGDADRDLLARLTTPTELSGLLNRALAELPALRSRGHFSASAVTSEAAAGFRISSDSAAGFIDDCCRVVREGRVAKPALYRAYKEWCEENGRRPLAARRFHARAKDLVPDADEMAANGVDFLLGLELEGLL